MKRRLLLSVLLILLILTMIGSVIFLNNPTVFQKKKTKGETDNVPVDYCSASVMTGAIEHYCQTHGQIISGMPSEYVDTLEIDCDRIEDAVISVKKGEEVSSGQVLLSVSEKKYTSVTDGKIVNITTEETEYGAHISISELIYEKLYIVASLKVEDLSFVGYDTPVKVTVLGKTYDTVFLDIGYEVSNGCVAVILRNPCKCLPGTDVDISILKEKIAKGMYVPKEFIQKNGEGCFVLRKKGEGMERIPVVIGEEFEDTEDTSAVYCEILSGVAPGDVLMTEMRTSGSLSGAERN